MATTDDRAVELLVDNSDCKVVKINSACIMVKYPKAASPVNAFAVNPSAGNIKLVPAGTVIRLTDKRYTYAFYPNLSAHLYGSAYTIKI